MSDHSDIAAIQKQLNDAALKLAAMTLQVAKARQVLSWESERRKVALAKLVAGYLEQGESASAAEFKARAHPDYTKQVATMFSQCHDAQKVIADHEATRTIWDSARSLLSMQKAIVDNV